MSKLAEQLKNSSPGRENPAVSEAEACHISIDGKTNRGSPAKRQGGAKNAKKAEPASTSPRQNSGRIFLVSGDDDAQISAAAAKLFAQLAGENPDDFSTEIIHEDDRGPRPELIQQLIGAIQTPAFMGGTKTIWLKNFTGFAAENSARSSQKNGDSMCIGQLARLLDGGIPTDIQVLLSGPDCDPRKPLATACAANGSVQWFNKPDRRKKNWREEMAGILQNAANAKGVNLSFEAKEALLDALGGDTALVDCELEKLLCHAGPGQTISINDVNELCGDYNEQPVWAINDLVGKRNLNAALTFIEGMINRSRNADATCRPLCALIGKYFREMLQLRLFMAERKLRTSMALKNFLDGLSAEDKKQADPLDAEIMKLNPWRAKFTADNALNFTPSELIKAVKQVRDCSLAMNCGAEPRVMTEQMLAAVLSR